MAERIRIARWIVARVLDEARNSSAIECCGLLAGRDGAISGIFPAQNALASATAYEIAPSELFSIFREIRIRGLDLLGIYHSHPRGENVPSTTDIERAYYPDAAYFIISLAPDAPRPVRAFRMRDRRVAELVIEEVQ